METIRNNLYLAPVVALIVSLAILTQQSFATDPPIFNCFGTAAVANQPCRQPSGCSGCYNTGDADINWEPTHGLCEQFGLGYSWITVEECVSDPEKNDGWCVDIEETCFIAYVFCILRPPVNAHHCLNMADWPQPAPRDFPTHGEGGCWPDPTGASCTECRVEHWGTQVKVVTQQCL